MKNKSHHTLLNWRYIALVVSYGGVVSKGGYKLDFISYFSPVFPSID